MAKSTNVSSMFAGMQKVNAQKPQKNVSNQDQKEETPVIIVENTEKSPSISPDSATATPKTDVNTRDEAKISTVILKSEEEFPKTKDAPTIETALATPSALVPDNGKKESLTSTNTSNSTNVKTPGRPKTKTEKEKVISLHVPVSLMDEMNKAKLCYGNNLTLYINSLIAADIEKNKDRYNEIAKFQSI